jgi:hypothetical protein
MKIVKLIPPKWRGGELEICILKVADIFDVPGNFITQCLFDIFEGHMDTAHQPTSHSPDDPLQK